MAGKFWGALAIVLGLGGILCGCAGAPPPPKQVLAPPPEVSRSPQAAALEVALNEFYGAPYHYGGTTPAGVDCSGLIQALYQRVGIHLPRTVAEQYQAGRPVGRDNLQFGDIVFFNHYCQNPSPQVYTAALLFPGWGSQVCHDGFYLGGGRFVHASPRGVFVSRLDAEVWKVSYCGARRYLPGGN